MDILDLLNWAIFFCQMMRKFFFIKFEVDFYCDSHVGVRGYESYYSKAQKHVAG